MRSREREAIATRAPSAASALAIPFPRPFEAPMTSATLPSIPRSMGRNPSRSSTTQAPSPNLHVSTPDAAERAARAPAIHLPPFARGRLVPWLRARAAAARRPHAGSLPSACVTWAMVRTAIATRVGPRSSSATWWSTAPVPKPHPPLKYSCQPGGATSPTPHRCLGTTELRRRMAASRWRATT